MSRPLSIKSLPTHIATLTPDMVTQAFSEDKEMLGPGFRVRCWVCGRKEFIGYEFTLRCRSNKCAAYYAYRFPTNSENKRRLCLCGESRFLLWDDQRVCLRNKHYTELDPRIEFMAILVEPQVKEELRAAMVLRPDGGPTWKILECADLSDRKGNFPNLTALGQRLRRYRQYSAAKEQAGKDPSLDYRRL